jgi:hypothetical protein
MAYRCKRNPPHKMRTEAGGLTTWHPSKLDCDRMVHLEQKTGTTPPGAGSTIPSPPPPSTPSSTEKPTPAPPPAAPAPSPAAKRRFWSFGSKAPSSVPGQEPGSKRPIADNLQVNPAWELTDELSARFWGAVLGVVSWTVRAIDRGFEVEDPYITKDNDPLELNQSDKLALGRSSRKAVTAGMKRLGVKSTEEAEKFINVLDGGKVIVAIVIGLVLHFIEELPKSGLVRRLKEDAAKNADPNAPPKARWVLPWQRKAPAPTAASAPTAPAAPIALPVPA